MSTFEARERDLVKCEDMRIHAERARDFLGSQSREDFLADRMRQDAIVRCIEVVGEAARLVSEETRTRAPEIPWHQVVGMRHILAHDYGTIDLDKVYDVASSHLPRLLDQLRALIATLERDVEWHDEKGT